jgi:phenylalanyl-tRNA synthetase beta chain
VLGVFGEMHPKVLARDGRQRACGGLHDLACRNPDAAQSTAPRPALTLRDLQAVERDFAFVLDAGVEALNVVNAAAGADKALIDRCARV